MYTVTTNGLLGQSFVMLNCTHSFVRPVFVMLNCTNPACTEICVIFLQAIVRTSAKAANIWEDPPQLRNIPAAQLEKFFDTVSIAI